MKSKGVIYSMDTVFAIYIVLLAVSSFTIMYNYANTFDRADLRLSRLSRDAYNIHSTAPGLPFPDDISINEKVCEAARTAMTGHAFILIADGGQTASDDFIACLIDPEEREELEERFNS